MNKIWETRLVILPISVVIALITLVIIHKINVSRENDFFRSLKIGESFLLFDNKNVTTIDTTQTELIVYKILQNDAVIIVGKTSPDSILVKYRRTGAYKIISGQDILGENWTCVGYSNGEALRGGYRWWQIEPKDYCPDNQLFFVDINFFDQLKERQKERQLEDRQMLINQLENDRVKYENDRVKYEKMQDLKNRVRRAIKQ